MIISNVNQTHLSKLKELCLLSDELVVFSPFCYQDFDDFFEEILYRGIKRFSLVTTLKSEDAIYKSNSLVSFVDGLNARKIKWDIKIDNKLHGKLYFFFKLGKIHSAIITSANLTENGMMRNHEWGYLTKNKSEITELYNQACSGIESQSLNENQLIQLMLQVDEYIKTHPNTTKPQTQIQIDINEIISKMTGIKVFPESKIFLKPIGSTDDKIYEGDYSEETEQYFSRRRPNTVLVGDYLVSYAVGSTKLLSVFQVTSEPMNTNKPQDRWPWYVYVKNITPIYGKNWFKSVNTLSFVSKKFLEINPKGFLTYNGGRTLGALNYGTDKIRLDNEFGKFLIHLIENSQENSNPSPPRP